MSIGNREQKKLKEETLGYSYAHHEQHIAYGDEGQEVAFTLGNGVSEATIIFTAEEVGGKSGITIDTGKTNIKLVTRAGEIKMVCAAQFASAATALVSAGKLMLKLEKGGIITACPLFSDYESVASFQKTLEFIPITGYIPDPILGISIDTDASKVVGYFDIHY